MRGDGRSGGARLAALALAVAVGAPAAAAPPARPPSSANPDVGPLDAASLARAAHGTRLVLPMPDGARVALSVERRRRPGPGRVTLSGPVVGSPAGRFVLAVNGSAVAGVVRLGVAGTFQVGGSGAALRVDRVDAGGLAPCGGATDCGAPPAGGVAGDDDGCEDGSVIDVLVLFTTTARIAAGTLAAIEAEIDMMMEDANVALASSDVPSELRLVLAWEVTIDESMLNVTALINAADGVLDGVHLLRDAYAADLVAVVRSGAGGVAAGLDSLDPANEAFAFSISGLASAPTLVLAHEIGHNLGACHAIGDGGGCDEDGGLLFPFSNGHRFTGDSGAAYRTVMAYAPGESRPACPRAIRPRRTTRAPSWRPRGSWRATGARTRRAGRWTCPAPRRTATTTAFPTDATWRSGWPRTSTRTARSTRASADPTSPATGGSMPPTWARSSRRGARSGCRPTRHTTGWSMSTTCSRSSSRGATVRLDRRCRPRRDPAERMLPSGTIGAPSGRGGHRTRDPGADRRGTRGG
jgi:hypothetical protein